MSARIFSPAKTAMQSGKAKTGYWVLEFDPSQPLKIDPLMGYTSSGDMKSQIKLTFETREEAEAYAKSTASNIACRSPRKPSAARFPTPTISGMTAKCPGRTEQSSIRSRSSVG